MQKQMALRGWPGATFDVKNVPGQAQDRLVNRTTGGAWAGQRTGGIWVASVSRHDHWRRSASKASHKKDRSQRSPGWTSGPGNGCRCFPP